MMTLTYILGAVVLLGLCIFVHELGHLLGGKMVGIQAKVFSMGYGRGFLKKTIGNTTYQIAYIPLGGYCQFYGEDATETRTGEKFEFLSAHPLRRIVAVAMGPLFNLLFGIILFYCMNIIGYAKETNRVMIPAELNSVQHVSPAYGAGIRTGDRIISIDNKKIQAFPDIQGEVFFSNGKELEVKVERGNEVKTFMVRPMPDASNGRFTIGIMPYAKGITVTRVIKGSSAESGGLLESDVIVGIDGNEVHSPSDFSSYIQSTGGKEVAVECLRDGGVKKFVISPVMTEIFMITSSGKRKVQDSFAGNEEFKKQIQNGEVRVDGKKILTYQEFVSDIEKGAGRAVTVDIFKKRYNGTVEILKKPMLGLELGVVFDTVFVKYGPLSGMVQSVVEPWNFLVMNIKGLGMLFKGEISVRENLSGPIRIAKIAGDVLFYRGFADYILLMAKISIILMFMNLLPIPAVDGSHLLLYLLETIRGKPLSEEVMSRLQTFGIVFLIILGVFVIINDISMLPAVQDLFK